MIVVNHGETMLTSNFIGSFDLITEQFNIIDHIQFLWRIPGNANNLATKSDDLVESGSFAVIKGKPSQNAGNLQSQVFTQARHRWLACLVCQPRLRTHIANLGYASEHSMSILAQSIADSIKL